MDEAIEKRIETLEKRLDKLEHNKSAEHIEDRCPVFYESDFDGPNATIGYCWSYGAVQEILPILNIDKIRKGYIWKTREAVTRYPNNPGIYKYLQIIWRDYGGEPSEEDWEDNCIDKYSISYNYYDKQWYGDDKYGGTTTGRNQGIIYMLKEPDIEAIEKEMGDLIEWLT